MKKMAKIIDLKRGDVVSFDIVRAGIIDEYSNVVVEAEGVGYDLAALVDSSIAERHYNLYPYFKDKVNNVNDPSAYNYLIVKANPLTNKLMAVGEPWIQESTLKSTSTKDVTLILQNFEEGKRASLETFLKNAKITYVLSE